jgi:polyphosphate glucokinase
MARTGGDGVVKKRARKRARTRKLGPYTLAIDIGGTHLKASVLDASGAEITPHVQEETSHPAPPERVLEILDGMVRTLPPFNRTSVGFPGVVKRGTVLTAPNLGSEAWHEFPLASVLAERWGRPARVLNDSEVQGFGVIEGKGLECVLTLGTGFGSALYRDGELMPHLELGQHPIWKGKTYDQYVGAAALKAKGADKWNRRLRRVIDTVHTLLNYDHLYLGGGDAHRIAFELPPNVTLVSNEAGLTGGIHLWDAALDRFFS